MLGLEQYLRECGLEESASSDEAAPVADQWLHLLSGHALDLRANGENEQRLYSFDADGT